jgi:hypothetical protein
LKRSIGAPIIQLGEYQNRSGAALAASLAAQLTATSGVA